MRKPRPLPWRGRSPLSFSSRRGFGESVRRHRKATVLGGGVEQDKAPASFTPTPASSVVSRGLVRSKTDKLMVVRGGIVATLTQGATALKGEMTEHPDLVGGVAFTPPQVESLAERRAEARMKGYVGEACPECGNFTMVRNGTCLKCDTCGGTTGCS